MDRCLVRLCSVALLEAYLLNVIQSLIRIDKDPCIVCFLLFALLRRLETLTEMTVLSKLVEEMQVAALLIVIIEYRVLTLDVRRHWLLHGNAMTAVKIDKRHLRLRIADHASISARLFLGLLSLLLLDLVLRHKPSLKSILLSLRLANVMCVIMLNVGRKAVGAQELLTALSILTGLEHAHVRLTSLHRHLLLRQHHNLIERCLVDVLEATLFDDHFDLCFGKRLLLLVIGRARHHAIATRTCTAASAHFLLRLLRIIVDRRTVVCLLVSHLTILLVRYCLTIMTRHVLRLISLSVVLFRVQMRSQKCLNILMRAASVASLRFLGLALSRSSRSTGRTRSRSTIFMLCTAFAIRLLVAIDYDAKLWIRECFYGA